MTAQPLTPLQPVQLPTGLKFRHLIHDPGQPRRVDHVPMPQLEQHVQVFLAKHRSKTHRHKTPRLDLVQGLPGTGKSQACLAAVLSTNTAAAVVPPSIFGSPYEGGAVQQITDLMHALERYSTDTQRHVAVIFEDLDASTLSTEKAAHTTNPKELIGHLQSLADRRDVHVCFDGSTIPWIATTNSVLEVRASMFRDMRATVYTHDVDASTKRKMLDLHFDPRSPEETRILDKLFKEHAAEQPAFWAALLHDYDSHRISNVIASSGFDMGRVDAELDRRRPPLDLCLLQRLARDRRAARPRNFLWKTN